MAVHLASSLQRQHGAPTVQTYVLHLYGLCQYSKVLYTVLILVKKIFSHSVFYIDPL